MRWGASVVFSCVISFSHAAPGEQAPLLATSVGRDGETGSEVFATNRNLHGRFLHITGIYSSMRCVREPWAYISPLLDIHPDPYYKIYSSTEEEDACHWGIGPAGAFGAETTDCDSPIALVNATFRWIDENLKDSIDFIIWGGDSARHDNDEELPRTVRQVEDTNEMLVNKFVEVFGKKDRTNDTDPLNDFIIPIVPTFGNNDILPHNIMDPGPNTWTKAFLRIWRQFIPEEQRHAFGRGGWFSVEVIPNRLAVFSLNTLYFYGHNAAVNGCAKKSEIGYEQMDWLRIQLQFIRQRGMKAIIMGHVPPGRTDTKRSWDETCWHKYTFWMQQYRDLVVGSIFGHMNFEHFMLQDWETIDDGAMNGDLDRFQRTALDEELTVQSTTDYLTQLRKEWSRIPDPEKFGLNPTSNGDLEFIAASKNKKQEKSKAERYYDKIGGEWAERYSVTLVTASVVPNYFPTLRVVEYNITGLNSPSFVQETWGSDRDIAPAAAQPEHPGEDETPIGIQHHSATKLRKAKKPKFTPPLPPSKTAPPGPAYSPQTLTWLSYTQYYANITTINNDFSAGSELVEGEGWHNGKHSGKRPSEGSIPKPHSKKFVFEVEYDTKTDKAYTLKDLTARSWLGLAGRIGRYRSCGDVVSARGQKAVDDDNGDLGEDWKAERGVAVEQNNNEMTLSSSKKETSKKPKKDKKKHDRQRRRERRKSIHKAWFSFVRRAYVGTRDEDDLWEDFA